jgi:hypothetical protein
MHDDHRQREPGPCWQACYGQLQAREPARGDWSSTVEVEALSPEVSFCGALGLCLTRQYRATDLSQRRLERGVDEGTRHWARGGGHEMARCAHCLGKAMFTLLFTA